MITASLWSFFSVSNAAIHTGAKKPVSATVMLEVV
jgi:hypothetical protein